MSQNKKLGKGLDALFGSNGVEDIGSLRFGNEKVTELPISNVVSNPDQPRRQFDDKSLQELATSIKEFGVLQPLVVTQVEQNKYSIIAGERRWRASKIAGLNKIPVIVRTTSELETLEMALIENVQREDLTPLEQAASIQRLHDQFSLSYETIAGKLGKAYSTVANLSRLLQLPDRVQHALRQKQITEGHARALLSLQDNPEIQQNLLDLILNSHLSVRQAEQFVIASKQKVVKKPPVEQTKSVTEETVLLSKHLGMPVAIQRLAKGGRLTIRYTSETELEKLVKRLERA